MSERTRAHLRLAGRVQGVGFRYSAHAVARRLGLDGWVRNLPGGGVETAVEGAADAVEQYVAWCRQGPPLAHVTTVDVRYLSPGALDDGFTIRQ